jgi:hypothetical protein
MTAPIRIASTKAFMREKWLWIPTVANTAAPTAVEINSASGLDVSCFLFADSGKPTQTTNRTKLARRLCDGAQYEQIGLTTYEGGELSYAVDPQAAPGANGKKALAILPAGTTGFLVRRLGIAVLTDVAAGQYVDLFPTEFGPAFTMPKGDDESSEVAVTQTFAITGPPTLLVAAA